MTDDFDFDFDVDGSRGASRTEAPDPDETPERERVGNGNRKGARGNGSRGYASRAKELLGRGGELLYSQEKDEATDAPRASTPPREPAGRDAPGAPAEDDWLSIGDDAFEPGYLSPLRERDGGPADRPTPCWPTR